MPMLIMLIILLIMLIIIASICGYSCTPSSCKSILKETVITLLNEWNPCPKEINGK